MLLDGVRGVDGDLVARRVAALDRQVEVDEVDVEVGQDQLLLDERPDDPGHLVAVELDDRVFDLDLGHGRRTLTSPRLRRAITSGAAVLRRGGRDGPVHDPTSRWLEDR